MQIRPFKDLVTESFVEIKQYQTGEKKIIKTGRPYIDDVGIGFMNGGSILLAAGSGVGKSFELSRLLRNIMDTKLNPNADKYVVLNISLEMKVLSLVLRELEGKLKKDKKQMLLEEFTEDEKKLVREYYEMVQDDRQFISQTPTTVKQFYQGCKDFLEQHLDKETVIISLDHLVLVTSDKGENKNQVVENLIEAINNLKMEYSNVAFILLSQTNSENQKRAKDGDIMSQPKDLDIYYSQFSFQVADYVCVITNPYKLGLRSYSKINPDRYPNLEDFFLEPDTKGRVSLDTDGAIYYHLLKCREAPVHYTDIYGERIHIPEKFKKKNEVNFTPAMKAPVFDSTKSKKPEMPVFENPMAGIKPMTDMSAVFDAPEKLSEEDELNKPF